MKRYLENKRQTYTDVCVGWITGLTDKIISKIHIENYKKIFVKPVRKYGSVMLHTQKSVLKE